MTPPSVQPILAHGGGAEGLLADPLVMLWSALLRIVEAAMSAAPYLLIGILVAGLLRGMVGPRCLQELLGGRHWSGPVRGWLLGLMLPVCALGVLPVARELRRAGVASGTVLTFLLVGPILNPASILYGLAHIPPTTLLCFVCGTFLIPVGLGTLWNRWFDLKETPSAETQSLVPRDARARLAICADTTARALIGPEWVDYCLVLLGMGLLGAFLPYGVLQTGFTRDNPLAPPLMALVAVLVYVTPLDAMMQFGVIARDGFSLAVAFVLFVLGPGTSAGVANGIRRDAGFRALLLFGGLLVCSTLAFGYAVDRAAGPRGALPEDHTHAFDAFTRVSAATAGELGWDWWWTVLRRSTARFEWIAFACLIGIGAAGLVHRVVRPGWDGGRLLVPPGDAISVPGTPWRNRSLSPGQTTMALAGVIVGLCAWGAYLLYPHPRQLLSDMNSLHAETVAATRSGDWETAARQLALWRQLAGKLRTGAWLRQGRVLREQAGAAEELLYSIDALRDTLEQQSYDEAELLAKYLDRVYRRCRDAYRRSESNPSLTALWMKGMPCALNDLRIRWFSSCS